MQQSLRMNRSHQRITRLKPPAELEAKNDRGESAEDHKPDGRAKECTLRDPSMEQSPKKVQKNTEPEQATIGGARGQSQRRRCAEEQTVWQGGSGGNLLVGQHAQALNGPCEAGADHGV